MVESFEVEIDGDFSSVRYIYDSVTIEEIREDYQHPNLFFESGSKVIVLSLNLQMELDLFLPEKNLAFEYQGEHHYQDIPAFAPHRQYVERDHQKRMVCEKSGITLVEVPYWWDFETERFHW